MTLRESITLPWAATLRRPSGRRGLAPRARAGGFTLIEVVVAAGLLSIVGLSIVAFVTAFARGAGARARISDPAIEGALLVERLRAVAPSLRAPLASDGGTVALWLSDRVPSRTVHLSELGWIRFDRTMGDVVLERVAEARFDEDRALETEFASDDDFLAIRDESARDGLLVETILAEGLDEARFVGSGRSGLADLSLELEAERATARVVIAPVVPEEPLR
jgi:hypothetical protein